MNASSRSANPYMGASLRPGGPQQLARGYQPAFQPSLNGHRVVLPILKHEPQFSDHPSHSASEIPDLQVSESPEATPAPSQPESAAEPAAKEIGIHNKKVSKSQIPRCKACNKAKTYCLPKGRKWPEKCIRCEKNGVPCSPPRSPPKKKAEKKSQPIQQAPPRRQHPSRPVADTQMAPAKGATNTAPADGLEPPGAQAGCHAVSNAQAGAQTQTSGANTRQKQKDMDHEAQEPNVAEDMRCLIPAMRDSLDRASVQNPELLQLEYRAELLQLRDRIDRECNGNGSGIQRTQQPMSQFRDYGSPAMSGPPGVPSQAHVMGRIEQKLDTMLAFTQRLHRRMEKLEHTSGAQ